MSTTLSTPNHPARAIVSNCAPIAAALALAICGAAHANDAPTTPDDAEQQVSELADTATSQATAGELRKAEKDAKRAERAAKRAGKRAAARENRLDERPGTDRETSDCLRHRVSRKDDGSAQAPPGGPPALP